MNELIKPSTKIHTIDDAIRLSKKRFEIKLQEFKQLNKTLQTIAVQSLYYGLRLSLKKQPRNENINNMESIRK